MTRTRGWPLAAVLLLSACGTSTPEATENRVDGGSAAPAAQAPADEAAPASGPAPAPAPADAPARGFPAALQGRWGLVAEDCRPGSDVAKGLMTVTADRATFWEARATAGVPEATGAGAWTIDLAFEGEGQSWTTRTSFRLSDDGRALTRTDRGWENGTFRYERCSA